MHVGNLETTYKAVEVEVRLSRTCQTMDRVTLLLTPTSSNTNETYDIGSSTLKFRDIYLSDSTIYLGDTALSDPTTQELQRKKKQVHTVNSIDTGATVLLLPNLLENSTAEESSALVLVMKAGTKLRLADPSGAKFVADFVDFTAENGGARGFTCVVTVQTNC